MEKVLNIVKHLEQTSSTNDKIAILSANKDNKVLRDVLYYTYSDHLNYGFSEQKLRELLKTVSYEGVDISNVWIDGFQMLDDLASSNINDNLRILTVAFLRSVVNAEIRELWIRILTKDLRCNISTKTINKAIPKLIVEWDIQQARPIDKVKLKKGKWIALSLKLNGVRSTLFGVEFRSRQNEVMKGLDHISEELSKIEWLKDYVIDGEMIRKNIDGVSDNENFRRTVSILNSDDGNKEEITFVVFDLLPKSEFVKGKSSKTFKQRLEELNRLKIDAGLLNLHHVGVAPVYYTGTDHSMIQKLLDKVDAEGKEGLMCLRDVEYQTKRHSGILKVKAFKTADVKIVGFEEGDGKYKDMLGAFIIDFKGNEVNVGSGYTDADRKDFWENRDSYIGKILEVKYKDETMNKKTKLISLQFPTFNCIRYDKTEPSYN